MTPNRPYLLRAFYAWIVDNALTPHLMVDATKPGVHVPPQHIKDGRIVLNIASHAIANLSMTNDWVNFDARFSGVLFHIRLPVSSISAVYAVENGRGMVFTQENNGDDDGDTTPPSPTTPPPKSAPTKIRPVLKIVK